MACTNKSRKLTYFTRLQFVFDSDTIVDTRERCCLAVTKPGSNARGRQVDVGGVRSERANRRGK